MDGEIDETNAGPGEPPDEQVTAEQLVAYLRKAHFEGTRGRRGYQIGEVNAFLNRLVELVEEGHPIAEPVRKQRFTTVRLEDGYDPSQVDHFLAAAVDVDPHVHAGRPEIGRSRLIAKLFG